MPETNYFLPADEGRVFTVAFDPAREKFIFVDIPAFTVVLQRCLEARSVKIRKIEIGKLLTMTDWFVLHTDKKTGKLVRAECDYLEHEHELHTARALSQVGYDVLFAPKRMFNRADKKFDVFLIRDHVILKADLKCASSLNPDTIANRIKGGAQQASRVVIDIISTIEPHRLIDGLRQGGDR
jgi:hypothetical protein